jgi:hypothetical protein
MLFTWYLGLLCLDENCCCNGHDGQSQEIPIWIDGDRTAADETSSHKVPSIHKLIREDKPKPKLQRHTDPIYQTTGPVHHHFAEYFHDTDRYSCAWQQPNYATPHVSIQA